MDIVFLTEMGFEGKVPSNHSNMRTEFAWMHALDADHRRIYNYGAVRDYDHVFIIFPKGRVYLDACGSKLIDEVNPASVLLSSNIIEELKQYNKKVYIVQEGPHWLWNDYEMIDQIQFYNMLISSDGIFAHNEHDVKYYKGMFPDVPVHVIPTLMIDSIVEDIQPIREEKVIIGGNFARWYGGMESFTVAQRFQVPIWGQTSHAMREGEDQLINHLPRVMWTDWMKQLSSFKYAVHLMPTIAAGTFSLNCAYFGIPCIGNEKVDTQRLCHPDLAVDVEDVERAAMLAERLRDDKDFYEQCSKVAKENYKKYYSTELFKQKINTILNI
jgi:uncharacterized membrane protein YfbV (UPF0208 family)